MPILVLHRLSPGRVALKNESRALEETFGKVPETWPQGRGIVFTTSGILYEFMPI